MLIKGPMRDNEDIVATLISKEWALRLTWPNGLQCVVCFHKGTWCVGRFPNGTYRDQFRFTDICDIEYCEDNVLHGLIEELTVRARQEEKENEWYRLTPARILVKTMDVWLHKMSSLESIEVLQPGRNSSISFSGDISLDRKDW